MKAMAIPSLPRPNMHGPQPVESTKVNDFPSTEKRSISLFRGTTGETADRVFKFVMLLCGLAVLGTLALIVYQLVMPEDANVEEGLISTASPIGRALLNKEEGDDILVTRPDGTERRFELVKLVTIHDV